MPPPPDDGARDADPYCKSAPLPLPVQGAGQLVWRARRQALCGAARARASASSPLLAHSLGRTRITTSAPATVARAHATTHRSTDNGRRAACTCTAATHEALATTGVALASARIAAAA